MQNGEDMIMDDLFPEQAADGLPALDRSSGLSRLQGFIGKAGGSYAKGRNYDLGPGRHQLVSCLSGHLRRRLMTEAEVIDAVLQQHIFAAAEKFITEVYWRTYFKGWLEMRPSVWQQWLSDLARLPRSAELDKACSGQTGIACFDAWASELVTTGYLHNHARMWFASIWIFTLRLPWQQGAAFFMAHLRDGDPASNTLGWRWVAGLQTRGKAYAARADNIDQFTKGRFAPHGQLNEHIYAVDGPENPPAQPLALPALTPTLCDGRPYMLLLTAEDGHPESLPLADAPVCVASLPALFGNHQLGLGKGWLRSPMVDQMDAFALHDTLLRAQSCFAASGCEAVSLDSDNQNERQHDTRQLIDQTAEQLASLCQRAQVFDLVTAYLPVGFWCTHYQQLAAHPALSAMRWHYVMRAYDRQAWPSATKGFFPFKSKIPNWLGRR